MAFLRRTKQRRRQAGVPRDFERAVVAVLGGLDDGAGSLARYVLTGVDPGALSRITNHYWGQELGHRHGHPPGGREAGLRVLTGFADVDTEVMHRWARVLQASAAGPGRWGFAMAPVGAGLEWPELVLRHARSVVPDAQPLPFTLDDLARVLERDGAGPADLLAAALEPAAGGAWHDQGGRPALPWLPGFDALLLEHREVVTGAATTGPADRREQTLELLQALDGDGLASYAGLVAVGVAANSTAVRRVARVLLDRLDPATVTAALREVATAAKPDERGRALQLLHDLAPDDDARRWVEETAAADRAGSVRGLVDSWRASQAAPAAEVLDLPPLAPVDWAVPRAAATAAASAVVDRLAKQVRSHNRQQRQWASQVGVPGHPYRPRLLGEPDRGLAGRLADALASVEPVRQTLLDADGHGIEHLATRALVRVAQGADPVLAVQLLRACGITRPGTSWPEVLEAVHAATGEPDLMRLQQLLDGVGADGFAMIWGAYARSWTAFAREWPDDQVWPFVGRNLEALAAAAPSAHDYWYDHHAWFDAVATFPTPPPQVVDRLHALALGSQKTMRGPAQDALTRDPARAARAAAALGDGRGEVRGIAARWLADIADPASLAALQAAWAKEKNDVVRGHLLDALEALGESPADYLDLEATAALADRVVSRGLPAAIAWLDWDAVPEVTWADSGDPVPRTVVQWLVGSAVKAKSPEPNAIQRRYGELMEPGGRERLGHHLLASWLAEDTRPVPIDVAEQEAQGMAANYLRWYAADPSSPYHGRSHAELTAMLLPSCARRPAGSATASKGLLAVVAATAGRDVVAPVERYLKEWYGQRAAQGKALIAMLAWVDHPAATQAVLSVGSRFRTRSFQQEATRQAEALAERRGWTLAELADRTIPSAGFDQAGELELSYGPRVFTARLLPDLSVVLHDPDGKQLKALPQPRQSDDADLAKDARKAFTAAKKDVKAIARQQTERLHEALCTERSWPADDWRRYLADHPVVGPATRRLVWVAVDGTTGEPQASFRPLDDGTLTDVADGEVVLEPHHRVRLAHDSVLAPDDVRAWVEHLADYEVDPLFQQLGRGTYELPEERRSEREVTDLEGHLVEAFALRGRALKAGWTRGGTEDAGWFYSYRKRFTSLGLVAQVGFTGNVLPEENRTVALTRLTFHRELPGDRGEVDVPLGDVPAVLLSEVVGDVRLLAADGPGYDPDWRRKTEL